MSPLRPGEHLGVASRGYLRLLWWFPKAGTPNCTVQANALREQWRALAGVDVEVVGCSLDPQVDLDAWGAALGLPFPLHSASHVEALAYGALREPGDPWRETLARRVAVIVDDLGQVLDRWDVTDPDTFVEQVTGRVAILRLPTP